MATLPQSFSGLNPALANAVADIADSRIAAALRSRTGLLALPGTDAQSTGASLAAAIAQAGVGGIIQLQAGATYLFGNEITLLQNQVLVGNQAIFKRQDQVLSTLTTPVTVNGASANVSVVCTVVSATGFYVGQRVALEDQTVGGQVTKSRVKATVTAVSGNQVTVFFYNSAAEQMVATSPFATWVETGSVSYTFPAGAYLCSSSRLLAVPESSTGVKILDLEIQGNAANNALGRRWELSPDIDVRAPNSILRGLQMYDAMADAMYHGAKDTLVQGLKIVRPAAMGVHFGATTAVLGAQRSVLVEFTIDSPGMGSPSIGHYGGYNSSHPAYPAIGFSRLTNQLVIQSGQLTNDSGSAGTYGCGISALTAGDNWGISFSNLHLSGFDKGLGPLLLVRSSQAGGYTSTPTDPVGDNKQAASSIAFNSCRFNSCYPPSFATAEQWQQCCVGANSGTFPQFIRVKFTDCEWLDSPMVIQESHVEFAGVNTFVATAISRSSTLTISGTTTEVDISNCVFRRPVTTSGNIGTEPGWYQYNCNLYAVGGKIRGSHPAVINGSKGIRAQNGVELDITGLRLQDNYTYGISAMSANTRVVLTSPKVKLNATADNGWVGIDCANGGGAMGAGAYLSVVGADVDAVTTSATQYGIRLPNIATAKATVVGSKIKVSGTSTTPVASGGATAIGVVANNLLSHTFTPGAAETSSGNVVSANV